MDFTALATAAFGGALIGAAASGLLYLNGRIAGISGIFGGLLQPRGGDTLWRESFVLGLLAGGLGLAVTHPTAFPAGHPSPLAVVVVAGFLVGVGTKIGNGCTSGHGVCGLARRSLRSLAATVTFMLTGAVTVYLVRHLLGGHLR